MALDFLTLLTVGIIITVVVAMSLATLWLMSGRPPSLAAATGAYISGVAAASSIFLRQYGLPELAANLQLNGFLAANLALLLLSVVYLTRSPLSRWAVWLPVPLLMLTSAWLTSVVPDFQLRLLATNLVSLYYYGLISLLISRHSHWSGGRPLLLFIAAPFYFYALLHLFRVALLGLAWMTDGVYVSGQTLVAAANDPTMVYGLLLNVVLSFTIAFSLLALHAETLLNAMGTLARTDTLTGMLNRRAFMELMERELSRSQRQGTPLAFMLIDIDHFKPINDCFGHLAGDAYLKALAQAIGPLLRKTDLLGRYGGEEFCVLLDRLDAAQAEAVGERVRETIADLSVSFGDNSLKTTISVGISFNIPSSLRSDELIRRADEALYRAKENGRNRVVMAAVAQA